MSDEGGRQRRSRDARGRGATIDELLDRAVAAINRGDQMAATALAKQVLNADEGNPDAEHLLAGLGGGGEIRRLTILFTDLVDSTLLSTRVEPETYRVLVGRYREQVLRIVERYEGHIASLKGDGLLAVFGHPRAHENDVRRAVQAGLEITREVTALSEAALRRFGVDLDIRVGVHRGLVYLDTAQDDVYGLAANMAARVSALAQPGTVVVSDAVELLVRNDFEMQTRPSAAVKGVEGLVAHHQVVGERTEEPRRSRPPAGSTRPADASTPRFSWPPTPRCTSATPNYFGCAHTPIPIPPRAAPTSMPPASWPAARVPVCSNCGLLSTNSTSAVSPRLPHSSTWPAGSPRTTHFRNSRGPRQQCGAPTQPPASGNGAVSGAVRPG